MTWHYILAKTNPRLLQYQRLTDHPDAATVEDQSKIVPPSCYLSVVQGQESLGVIRPPDEPPGSFVRLGLFDFMAPPSVAKIRGQPKPPCRDRSPLSPILKIVPFSYPLSTSRGTGGAPA
jgi:hypothetical protein